MRVTVLSQYYSPEPVDRPVHLARALANRGHQVTVVTGFPHYPIGRTYPGYRVRPVTRETIDGIQVIRVFEYPYHGQSAARRIMNYSSFMVSATLLAPMLPDTDVLYVRHPPLTIGLAASALARFLRCPFVYDVQDIWPESAVLSGMMREGALVRLMRRVERFVYRRADRIIAVTDDAKRNIASKGALDRKIVVFPGWVDDRTFEPVAPETAAHLRTRLGWDRRFVVLFAGNLGIVQGIDTILEAAKTLRGEAVLFAFVGEGSEKRRLEQRVVDEALEENVEFLPGRPSTEMPPLFAAADALLLHLKSCELDRYVVPAKLLSYLAAGRPIVAAVGGAAAQLVETAEAGPVVPPDSPRELAAAVRVLAATPASDRSDYGRHAAAYGLAHHAKSRVIPLYEALLHEAYEGGREPLAAQSDARLL